MLTPNKSIKKKHFKDMIVLWNWHLEGLLNDGMNPVSSWMTSRCIMSRILLRPPALEPGSSCSRSLLWSSIISSCVLHANLRCSPNVEHSCSNHMAAPRYHDELIIVSMMAGEVWERGTVLVSSKLCMCVICVRGLILGDKKLKQSKAQHFRVTILFNTEWR